MSTPPDFVAYHAKRAAVTALRMQTRPLNKTALFDALAAAGIHQVIVEFDGSGDSGQIENVTATVADDTQIDLPQMQITVHDVDWEKMSLDARQMTAAQAIEDLTYDLLGETHGSWGNDDGAYGDVTFDVNARSITLEFNERYTSTTHHVHTF
jgi:hypothetical protein